MFHSVKELLVGAGVKYFALVLTLFTSFAQGQQMPKVEAVAFKKDTFSILAFGAKADGIALNTASIAKAIDACSKAGGGTVVVPKGFWLTGPVVLKSNVNLHLSKGAVLQFSNNTSDYPLLKTNWEGLEAIRAQSPIYALNQENIAVTGLGIIDGAGEVWRPVKKSKLTAAEWKQLLAPTTSGQATRGVLNEAKDTWYPTEQALAGSKAKRPGVVAEGYTIEKAEAIREFLRPNMVNIVGCKRVLFEGVTIQNSPAWCIHPLLTQHLTLRNLTVRNPWNAQNGDGVDIESCRYVLVENCMFDVGDDGICIKSGRDEEGRKRGVPTEDVIIRGSTVFHGHGGFVVGSEMSGGARNIFVSDCNFIGTDVGLRFKTARGRGGVVEKIYIDNICMSNIGGAAILFDMYYMARDPLAMYGGDDKPAVEVFPVTEATPRFQDIHIKNVVCKGAETGIFVRGLPEMNIQRIEIENVSIQSKQGFFCQDGDNVIVRNADLMCDEKTVVSLNESKNITLDNIRFRPGGTVVKIEGSQSKGIKLVHTDVKSAGKEVELGANVEKAVWSRQE